MFQSGIGFTDFIIPAEALQQNNYVSGMFREPAGLLVSFDEYTVAIAAAVVYDYGTRFLGCFLSSC